MSDTRLSPSERLRALAQLPRFRMEIPAEDAIVCIASNSHGNYSRGQITRDAMITLAREVCDHNGWKYNGSR